MGEENEKKNRGFIPSRKKASESERASEEEQASVIDAVQDAAEQPDTQKAETTAATETAADIPAETGKKKGKIRRGLSRLRAFMGKPAVDRKINIHIKRGVVTAVVVVVVVVAAGLGFNYYHEQPRFCGDICHTAMDGYVPTYYSEPGEASVDKWGNEVEDASSMLAAVHREYGDLTCMSCHEPSIVEQASEGLELVTGNYYAPLSERNLTNLVAYRAEGTSYTEFCLNESCHNMTLSDLTEATSEMTRNPHSWHHWEYTCSDCHKAHRASVMVCERCHDDAEVPDGWLTQDEVEELDTTYGAYDDEEE